MTPDMCGGPIRRKLLGPARPVPAGLFVRLATYLAVLEMLVYIAQKVYMAGRGEIGMPGHPAPDSVQARFAHAGLAQAANAALGALAATVALATVTRWGARIPRWALCCALVLALVMLSLGAVATLGRPDVVGGRLGWSGVWESLREGGQLGAWLVVAVSYGLRTRPPRDRPAAGAGR
ncbi:hypothetical protein ACGFOU_27140 [Streptomyces sp. NPDC048595]|uniref:hypothetical protein n=1 Tax=Streptomyces sp. NPDC048595 TaxID=3365576 RepID=UPI003720D757